MQKIMIPLCSVFAGKQRERLEVIITDVLVELGRGDAKYGRHPGPKRAMGALLAEVTELENELFAEDSSQETIRKEAIQSAAMAIKFIRDYCDMEADNGQSS